MNDEIKLKINELAGELSEYEENDDFKSYKVHPLMKEVIKLLDENQDEELSTPIYTYAAYDFIADKYTRLTRFSLAGEYEEKAIDLALKYFKSEGKVLDGFMGLFVRTMKHRNAFIDDDCEDLINRVKDAKIIRDEELTQAVTRTLAHRRTIKNDPVEMTKEYLDVIDEVEYLIEKNKTMEGMGSCFEYWDLKQQYLAERGIYCRSPALLNPRMRFD